MARQKHLRPPTRAVRRGSSPPTDRSRFWAGVVLFVAVVTVMILLPDTAVFLKDIAIAMAAGVFIGPRVSALLDQGAG